MWLSNQTRAKDWLIQVTEHHPWTLGSETIWDDLRRSETIWEQGEWWRVRLTIFLMLRHGGWKQHAACCASSTATWISGLLWTAVCWKMLESRAWHGNAWYNWYRQSFRVGFDSVRPDEVTSNLGEQNDTIETCTWQFCWCIFGGLGNSVCSALTQSSLQFTTEFW